MRLSLYVLAALAPVLSVAVMLICTTVSSSYAHPTFHSTCMYTNLSTPLVSNAADIKHGFPSGNVSCFALHGISHDNASHIRAPFAAHALSSLAGSPHKVAFAHIDFLTVVSLFVAESLSKVALALAPLVDSLAPVALAVHALLSLAAIALAMLFFRAYLSVELLPHVVPGLYLGVALIICSCAYLCFQLSRLCRS